MTETNNAYQPPQAELQNPSYCRECGTAVAKSAFNCPACGAPTLKPGRSKVAAGFLALFLGGLGLHRFYLGQWWGIFYIPFGLIGISFPVTLVEAIYFWVTSKENWDRKYGHLPPSNAFVIIAVILVVGVMSLGILAAVAIPAYQDYTTRSKVFAGITEMRSMSLEVEQYYLENNAWPNSYADLNRAPYVPKDTSTLTELSIGTGGTIVGTFKPNGGLRELHTLVLTPTVEGGAIASWSCFGGTMPDLYRPSSCRGGDSAETGASSGKVLHSKESNATISVPISWLEGIIENPDASIEAGNVFREAYVLVIEDSLEDLPGYSLEQFAQEVTDDYTQAFGEATLISLQPVTTNGLAGYSAQINAKYDDIELVYFANFYFSQTRAFQVLTWSLKSELTRNRDAMKDLLASFRAN